MNDLHEWHCRDYRLSLNGRMLVMGIVNVTPDSFSDGGRYHAVDQAIAHAMNLVEEGADILDLGGESTRPGATPVSVQDEIERVVPVVRELVRRTKTPLSIDTTKAEVARRCLDEGAAIINDISGMTWDAEMPKLAGDTGAGIVLMHIQGTPQTMQNAPSYDHVVAEVVQFHKLRLQALDELGITAARIAIDPGIGFGKTPQHNLELLAHLGELRALGCPICLGVSRKGFIGTITKRTIRDRLPGSLAVASYAATLGVAQIVRVHDVGATADAVAMIDALRTASREGRSTI